MRRVGSFPPDPQSVAAARRFAAAALAGAHHDVLEAVELMVSELATNSIRHAGTGFQLMIERAQGAIRVEVTDHAGGTPRMRSPGPDEPTGRGLCIVDMLSEAWGVEHTTTHGKTVWFTLAAAPTFPAAKDAQRQGPHEGDCAKDPGRRSASRGAELGPSAAASRRSSSRRGSSRRGSCRRGSCRQGSCRRGKGQARSRAR